jgi:hypothetical protein
MRIGGKRNRGSGYGKYGAFVLSPAGDTLLVTKMGPMLPEIIDGIEFFLYKTACLGVGLAFCYMGYRLFLAGIQKGETDLEFSNIGWRFKVAKAAPGTCYAIVGAAIVGFAICKGFSSTGKIALPSYGEIETATKAELPEKLPRN